MNPTHDETIASEFAGQAVEFDRARPLSSGQAVGDLLDLIPADSGKRWLDVACGTGIVSRELARRSLQVTGVDLTREMLDVAAESAARDGLDGIEFLFGDATALSFGDGEFDGAVTRFSLHHVPAFGRVVAEMARVVRPGGSIVISDHVTDADMIAAAWHQEVERLRDPSHWAWLSVEQLETAAAAAGLEFEEQRSGVLELDYEGWLSRSSAGAGNAALIGDLLERRPPSASCFRLEQRDGSRRLLMQLWAGHWRRP